MIDQVSSMFATRFNELPQGKTLYLLQTVSKLYIRMIYFLRNFWKLTFILRKCINKKSQ